MWYNLCHSKLIILQIFLISKVYNPNETIKKNINYTFLSEMAVKYPTRSAPISIRKLSNRSWNGRGQPTRENKTIGVTTHTLTVTLSYAMQEKSISNGEEHFNLNLFPDISRHWKIAFKKGGEIASSIPNITNSLLKKMRRQIHCFSLSQKKRRKLE